MEKPLILVEGRFALVSGASFKDESVRLVGDSVGVTPAPVEVILSEPVLAMIDLVRTPGPGLVGLPLAREEAEDA